MQVTLSGVILLSIGLGIIPSLSQAKDYTIQHLVSEAVSVTAVDDKNSDDKIKLIQEIYADINQNLDNFKQFEFEIHNKSAEGGYVKLYTYENELKKVEEVYFGETGKKVYEYYYDQDQLRFIFEQNVVYNTSILRVKPEPYFDMIIFDENKSMIEEDSYYFYDGEMIKWLDKNKKSVARNTPRFHERQNTLLNKSILN